MTHAIFSLADRFPRLRIRRVGPVENRNRALSVARANTLLRRVRTSPEMADSEQPGNAWDRLAAALRRRRVRKQWQRDLQTMDDRLLRDIGVSRADAEQAIRRLRIWI